MEKEIKISATHGKNVHDSGICVTTKDFELSRNQKEAFYKGQRYPLMFDNENNYSVYIFVGNEVVYLNMDSYL